MGIFWCGALLAMIALLAPGLAAQSPPNSDLSELNLEQLMKVQFYTASKHGEDMSATPASVTIVTRADIRTYGYRTLADVLQGVRGYWVNSDRNYSYLGVRGFARPGDYNTRILLLVNGHRLNDNIFYQALIGTEFPLDLDLIERIEIVRGATSSLYGTNAFFGVVNVITRQPPISPTVETSVEAGTQFTRKARVTIGLPGVLDGALLSATMYRSDGNEHLYFPEFDSPESNHGVAHRVDGDRYESVFTLARWKHWTFQGAYGSREKLIPTASFGTIFNDPLNRTVDSRGFGELVYQRDFISGLQLTSRWFYDAYFYRGTYVYDEDGSRVLNYDTARGDWVGAETNISRPLGRNRITGGIDFRYNLRQRQQNRWQSAPDYVLDDHRSGSVVAFYVQDELNVTSRLSLSGGLRVDRYSRFDTSFNPRLAVIFRPDTKTAVKYMFGHAFRVPNAYELYYSDSVSQEPNPKLQPETIHTHNIAVERALTANVRAVAEVFYSRLDSLLDTRVNPATGMSQFVNVDAVTAKGFEVQVDVQRGRWRGDVSYTFQHGQDHQSQGTAANLPQHLAKLKAQAPLGPALVTGAELRYESEQATYLNVRVPESFSANLTLSTRKPILGFEVSASCYNLFDRRHYDPGAPGLEQSRLLMDGREFRFKISRTFSRQ
ncbi:MAG: TonB-dependent receptor plug domain-containing protein [Terriglobales bacterium]